MLGNHLIGIYEKAMPLELSWRERLTQAALLGFDFIELSIDESEERIARLSWSPGELRELTKAVFDTGIGIRSLCLSAHRRFPFGSVDASARGKAREIAERAVAFTLELGIRVIQVAGYDVYYEPSTEESRAFFLEGLSGFVELAEKCQVMLAIEIMDTDFVNSVSAYRKIKAAIPSPWLTVFRTSEPVRLERGCLSSLNWGRTKW
jgi:hexulose-6-phosphate isomerase